MNSIVKKKSEIGLWWEDSNVPKINDNEVLIKIRKTAICGTDLHIYNWNEWAQKNVPVPLVVGHEFAGEIVEMGKNVKGFKIGDRVSGEGHITCGICPNCHKGLKHLCLNTKGVGYHIPGCFGKYFCLNANNVFLLPDYVTDDIAAILDPFGNAVHTALSFNLVGENVLITGAGPIGIMTAAIAKKAGARKIVITDINDYRLELARKMGATTTINVSNTSLQEVLPDIGIKYGFTVGMEMSGSPEAFSSMLETAQPGAKIALLGILPSDTAINWDLVIFKMLTLKGIYGREIFSTWYQMVHLIESGLDLSPIITHQFSSKDFKKGIDVMQSGKCGKVILSWSD